MTSMTSMTIPNLAGVASKDLVEKIGSGSYSAAYINWSRTMNLLRQHAPNWLVDYMPARDGSLLHQAPVGAYLLIRFTNMETGFSTPALPQAVMDNKNKSIPFERISSRDISDTQRRGMCMAAAMHFGLAYELWAKLPMENAYAAQASEDQRPPVPMTGKKVSHLPQQGIAEAVKASESTFREFLLEKGVHTAAIDSCVEIVIAKLDGDWAKGQTQVGSLSAKELNQKYGPSREQGEAIPNEEQLNDGERY
tara:strand:- start:5057 stop:5809 length:753 start_codon:yes stop_codon:yes gene_type:complete